MQSKGVTPPYCLSSWMSDDPRTVAITLVSCASNNQCRESTITLRTTCQSLPDSSSLAESSPDTTYTYLASHLDIQWTFALHTKTAAPCESGVVGGTVSWLLCIPWNVQSVSLLAAVRDYAESLQVICVWTQSSCFMQLIALQHQNSFVNHGFLDSWCCIIYGVVSFPGCASGGTLFARYFYSRGIFIHGVFLFTGVLFMRGILFASETVPVLGFQ